MTEIELEKANELTIAQLEQATASQKKPKLQVKMFSTQEGQIPTNLPMSHHTTVLVKKQFNPVEKTFLLSSMIFPPVCVPSAEWRPGSPGNTNSFNVKYGGKAMEREITELLLAIQIYRG